MQTDIDHIIFLSYSLRDSVLPSGHYGNGLWKWSRKRRVCVCVCVCYLGHLRAQVDFSQVDGLMQQVVEQLAEQDAISQSLSQVTHLEQQTHTKSD